MIFFLVLSVQLTLILGMYPSTVGWLCDFQGQCSTTHERRTERIEVDEVTQGRETLGQEVEGTYTNDICSNEL